MSQRPTRERRAPNEPGQSGAVNDTQAFAVPGLVNLAATFDALGARASRPCFRRARRCPSVPRCRGCDGDLMR
jgi:hypothetical protein